jgi:AraC-like DNA-binding protein
MYSSQEMLFSASVAVYIAVSLVVAAIRWGHKCQPYARHADYYYPAWKALVFCYMSNLLLCPIVFMPTDADAVLYLRMMLILASPFLCALVLFSYFGKVLNVGWWRNPIYALAIPFGLMTLTALVLTLIPGSQLQGSFCLWFFSVSGVLALLYLGCFVMSIRLITRALRRFSEDNYSNPDDFPRQFAKGILWIPIMHVTASWVTTFIGSPGSLSLGVLLLAVISVTFLIGALAPHRTLDVERLESGEFQVEAVTDMQQPDLPVAEPQTEPEEEALSQERMEEIAGIVRLHVEDEQAYLDSHLTLSSLSRICGVNRTYLSLVISERMGGFYNYVNRCRLAHVARLKVQHPNASIEEIVIASGFGSRQSYYNVRRQLE